MKYPKIETLFDRLEEGPGKIKPVDTTAVRCPEFRAIHSWTITEKIDGTNIRVKYVPVTGEVRFYGREDNAQLSTRLFALLQDVFTTGDLGKVFPSGGFGISDEVWLFGEGYGEGINKGHLYCTSVSLRLFDVNVGGWWLEMDNVMDIAIRLGIDSVPVLATAKGFDPLRRNMLQWMTAVTLTNATVQDLEAGHIETRHVEGVVARSNPMMMFRNGGHPIRWKLKFSDFLEEDRDRELQTVLNGLEG